jgi:hypothetical protein
MAVAAALEVFARAARHCTMRWHGKMRCEQKHEREQGEKRRGVLLLLEQQKEKVRGTHGRGGWSAQEARSE